MPRTKISEFSSTPANNTDIDSINISEGCAPSGINDAIRELMAQLKDWQSGTSNDPMVIGSSGSLTLNQGTANGVTYLNGSKVVTSGSALVFDGSNLGINSSVTALTNYRGAEFAGTSTTTGGFLRMRSSDSSINSLDFTDSNGRAIFTTTSHPVRFGTNDTERARIDSSGNLGLGVTPSAWSQGKAIEVLQAGYGVWNGTASSYLLANAYFNTGFKYGVTGQQASHYYQYQGAHVWSTAPSGTAGNAITFTQAMTLDASGNLGIGETSPDTRAHIYGASTAGRGQLYIQGSGTTSRFVMANSSDSYSLNTYGDSSTSLLTWDTNSGYGFRWTIADTERARIDSSGNLLVGTTTSAGSRVFINGDGTNPAFRSHAATSNTSVYAGIFRHESTTSGAYIQFLTDGSVETGRIYDSGGTMQYASSSDARLKTNVQPLQNGLSSVLAMNPCTYNIRRGESATISSAGLIAQEVYEIYPYAVGVGGDDENTNPWSVDYGKLTPLLIKAIKEQQAIIESLKARLDAANL